MFSVFFLKKYPTHWFNEVNSRQCKFAGWIFNIDIYCKRAQTFEIKADEAEDALQTPSSYSEMLQKFFYNEKTSCFWSMVDIK